MDEYPDEYDLSDPANWDFQGDDFNIFRHDYLRFTERI
ncbi:hypothetical protein KIV65_gp48 [Mycobacterium phage Anthony]|uniref:Uncharacterized protein n=1 Tax=Mycobacterium phage Anthony TaxID=2599857 RepID=A0A5J6THJ6_9CAUD|nr:hypothetical protein KIV65_gp48 [Mycobacterium phage Anthony]QFG10463.1 hypothetical protein PBI_ANTHONY_49 [Mycobacterium phage Anthony]